MRPSGTAPPWSIWPERGTTTSPPGPPSGETTTAAKSERCRRRGRRLLLRYRPLGETRRGRPALGYLRYLRNACPAKLARHLDHRDHAQPRVDPRFPARDARGRRPGRRGGPQPDAARRTARRPSPTTTIGAAASTESAPATTPGCRAGGRADCSSPARSATASSGSTASTTLASAIFAASGISPRGSSPSAATATFIPRPSGPIAPRQAMSAGETPEKGGRHGLLAVSVAGRTRGE